MTDPVPSSLRGLPDWVAVQRQRLPALSGDAFLAATTVVMGLGISYVLQILLARRLGSQSFGDYSYVLGWVNVAQVLVTGELSSVALRFAGTYIREHEPNRLRAFLRHTVTQVLATSALLMAAALVIVSFRDVPLSPQLVSLTALGALALPLVAFSQLGQGLLIAAGRGRIAQVPYSVLRPLLFLLGFAAWSQLSAPTTTLALGLNVLSTGIATTFTFVLLWRILAPMVRGATPEPEARRWMVSSVQLSILTFAQLVISQQSDVVVVGSMVGTVAAGHYAAAGQIAMLLRIAPAMLGDLNSPKLASLYRAGDRLELARLVRRLNRFNLLTAIGLAVLLAATAPFLLTLYGKDFSAIYPTLLVLLVVQIAAIGITGVGTTVLTMTGKERSLLPIVGIAAGFNIVAAIVLTPRLGAIGAALATLLATILRGVMTRIAVQRSLKFSMGAPDPADERTP